MNKASVTNKEELELYYSKARKIKFADNFTPKTIKEIFVKLNTANDSETVYIRNGEHCEAYRNRSITDLILLSKKYFPDMSVKQILQDINKILNIKCVHLYVYTNYCPTIKKNNFWKSNYLTHDFEERFNNVNFNNNGFPNLNLKIKNLIK